jgi:flagellin
MAFALAKRGVVVSFGSITYARSITRHLSDASDMAAKAMERLASGQRIRRASDDAAGLAVSSTLDGKARVLSRAYQNVSDGISLLNIADSAAGSLSGLLGRMMELASQAANGVLSRQQRQSLDREYNQLDLEIRRISDTTEFNGQKLFEGKAATDASTTTIFTSAGSPNTPDISGDGRFVAYVKSNTELVLHDNDNGSDTTIGLPSGATRFNGTLSMTASGDIVFSARRGAGRQDLFFYDRSTGQSRRLTDSQSVNDAVAPAVSADGSTVVWQAKTVYQDGGSALTSSGTSANTAIYSLNVESGIVRKVDCTGNMTVWNYQFSLSADGSKVAFRTSDNLTGQNSEGGVEIFAADLGSARPQIAQVTQTTSMFSLSDALIGINNQGDLYLKTNLDLLGQNSQGKHQIYRASITGGVSEQLTHNTTDLFYNQAKLASDGSSIFIFSSSNFVSENPNGVSQLFRFDLGSNSISQLTQFSSQANIQSAYLSSDGSRLAGIDQDTGLSLVTLDLRRTTRNFDFEAGFGASGAVLCPIEGITSAIRGLGSFMLTSQSSARGTLERMQANLSNLSQLRGIIGASQSRLSVAAQLSLVQSEQCTAASSRIKDADVAQEAGDLLRANILRNVGAGLLSQANQDASLTLDLLKF